MSLIEFATRTGRIEGLVFVTMRQVSDERGTLREAFRRSAFEAAGVAPPGPFLQLNVTESRRGAVRGMHAEAMTKLLAVVAGEAHGAWVDLRRESPTFGVVDAKPLAPGTQVLVPPGVANGFQALSDSTQYLYGFDAEWHPGMAGSACNPLDPALAIAWPLPVDPDDRAQISAKDLNAPLLADLKGRGTP